VEQFIRPTVLVDPQGGVGGVGGVGGRVEIRPVKGSGDDLLEDARARGRTTVLVTTVLGTATTHGEDLSE